jgi:hypothetical protein
MTMGANPRCKVGGMHRSSAVGARIEAPKAPRGVGSGEGVYPFPSRLGGLGERRELPQRGPGRSPGRQRFWYILSMKERRWWHLKVSHFGSMIIGNFYYFSFFKLRKQFASLLSELKYRGNCLVKCQSNKYHIVTPLQSHKISMPLLLLPYVLNV